MINRQSIFKNLLQAAIAYSCLFLYGCENDVEKLNAWTKKKIMVEEATNVESLLSQEGKLRAKLTAPLMFRYQSDTIYIEFPKKLHVDFFDSTGKRESQLDALYGKYFESLNKVYLRDSVVVANIKGDTLRCPDLWWDQNTRKFYTDKLVRLKTVDKQIYGGRGMEADQDLSGWSIFEPTGIVSMQDSTAF